MLSDFRLRGLSLIGFVLLWQLLALALASPLMPSPLLVMTGLWDHLTEGELLSSLGITLARTGRVAEAERHFQTALRIRPGHGGTHFNLATALANQGRYDEAAAHYAEALRIHPDDPETQRRLNQVLRLKDEFE